MALIQHLQLLVPAMKVDGRDAETILQKLAEQHLENSKKVLKRRFNVYVEQLTNPWGRDPSG